MGKSDLTQYAEYATIYIIYAPSRASNEYGGRENDSRRFDYYAARLPQ